MVKPKNDYNYRQPHWLKPIKTARKLQRNIYLDTETTITTDSTGMQHHRLKVGYAIQTRRRDNGEFTKGNDIVFYTPQQWCDWLIDQCPAGTTTYVWAHNMGYDFRALDALQQMTDAGFDSQNPIIESPPFIYKFSRRVTNKKYIKIIYVDSLNIWQVSLAKIAKMLGMEKGDWRTADQDMSTLIDYCKQDVAILRTAMEQWYTFLDDNDFGNVALTIAGQAFTTWRYKFLQHKIFMDDNPQALDLARATYYGGRTEAFWLGERWGRYVYVDVNSMYPSVMRDNPYPTVLKSYMRDIPVGHLRHLLNKYLVCADVDIDTDINAYPLRTKSKLIFPVGKFRTQLATPELVYAMLNGHVKKVHAVACYSGAYIFRGYVNKMYNLRRHFRERGNDVYATMIKFLLNSLYGKFGQSGIVYKDYQKTVNAGLWSSAEYDMDTKTWEHIRQVGNVVQKRESTPESTNSHPAIAAHVTSYARMLIWELMMQAGLNNIYYSDTDSLVVNLDGFERLQPAIHPSKLGALAVEDYPLYLNIKGAKDYTIGYRSKLKGVKASAVHAAGFSRILLALMTPFGHSVRLTENVNTYSQLQWVSLKRDVQDGKIHKPRTKVVIKNLNRQYKKGRVSRTGVVTPWRLPTDRKRIAD